MRHVSLLLFCRPVCSPPSLTCLNLELGRTLGSSRTHLCPIKIPALARSCSCLCAPAPVQSTPLPCLLSRLGLWLASRLLPCLPLSGLLLLGLPWPWPWSRRAPALAVSVPALDIPAWLALVSSRSCPRSGPGFPSLLCTTPAWSAPRSLLPCVLNELLKTEFHHFVNKHCKSAPSLHVFDPPNPTRYDKTIWPKNGPSGLGTRSDAAPSFFSPWSDY
ncbi:uncharacterized protein LOC129456307 [Periophthalmus magnuspinnatus]|uniref:uncharacterized protein LOC129456307 n=1 Tax=Periophthalmus magnuspinnatus TaxID=409849 RepID=UPI002437048E|nr:uncharacterized protein LOC129456307 [Periophthalmus magnuspinnatus]